MYVVLATFALLTRMASIAVNRHSVKSPEPRFRGGRRWDVVLMRCRSKSWNSEGSGLW